MTAARARQVSLRDHLRLFRFGSRFLLRALVLVAIGTGAAWLSVGTFVAATARSSQPSTALAFLPFDARSKAAQAEVIFEQASSARGWHSAELFARQALQRDPTVIPAWSVLGTTAMAAGHQDKAAEMFSVAERLSRRHAATEIWLIEENVRRNDILGALRRYDIALRTSISARDLLIPVLVSAAASPHVVKPLARVLAQEPEWATLYYAAFIQAPATGAGGAALVQEVKNLNPGADLRELRPLPALLAQEGNYRDAKRTYQMLAGAEAARPLVRNGGFQKPSQFPWLEWEFSTGSGLLAEIQPLGEGKNLALRLSTDGGSARKVARQMLLLPAGSFELEFVAKADTELPPGELRWVITCGVNNTVLLRSPVRLTGNPSSSIRRFQVPSGCPSQWLTLEISAENEQQGAAAWMDSVAVQPTI